MKKVLKLFIIGMLVLVVVWLVSSPSHDRNWGEGQSRLPTVTFSDDEFTITNVRNWSYTTDGVPIQKEWDTVTIRKDDLDSAYFLIEPFSKWRAVAHTMIAFTLTDGSGYVISVESRREEGEKYNAIKGGLLPVYEYLFVWSTERDVYGETIYFSEDELYWYKLELSEENKWIVVEALAEETQKLAEEPRWYSTLFANCTNVLASVLNKKTDNALPFNIAWVLPGYSPSYLYKQGLFDDTQTLEELKESGRLSPVIPEAYRETDPQAFSKRLRDLLK